MNPSMIQSIFKFNPFNDHKYLKIKLNKNIQIIKLKGKNHLKNHTNFNGLKISTHYMGEIDKNNFGVTTSKLNLNLLRNLKKEKTIFKKFSNKEIYHKYYLNCFKTPENSFRNNENLSFKFDKIDIPQYKSSSDLSFENFKNSIIKNKKYNYFNNSLLDSLLLERKFKKENLYSSSLIKNQNFENNFNDNSENINDSRNINFLNSTSRSNFYKGNIKIILSKKPQHDIYPYELKYRKIKSNNFFNNDSLLEDNQNNSFNKNNFNYRKIFINSKKRFPISIIKTKK